MHGCQPCSSSILQPVDSLQQQHMARADSLLCGGRLRGRRTSLPAAWANSSRGIAHSSRMLSPTHALSSNPTTNSNNSSSRAALLPPGLARMLPAGPHSLQHVRCAAFGSSKGGSSSSSKPKTQHICQNCGAGERAPTCVLKQHPAQHLVLVIGLYHVRSPPPPFPLRTPPFKSLQPFTCLRSALAQPL
jgi:hypothetical protein